MHEFHFVIVDDAKVLVASAHYSRTETIIRKKNRFLYWKQGVLTRIPVSLKQIKQLELRTLKFKYKKKFIRFFDPQQNKIKEFLQLIVDTTKIATVIII